MKRVRKKESSFILASQNIEDFLLPEIKEFTKPLLSLTIDEHTGEAGFITRLEAFVDMLYRKKRSKIINKLEETNYEFAPKTNICDFIKIDN